MTFENIFKSVQFWEMTRQSVNLKAIGGNLNKNFIKF